MNEIRGLPDFSSTRRKQRGEKGKIKHGEVVGQNSTIHRRAACSSLSGPRCRFGSAHQRRRERQASHGGLQLVHRRRDAHGGVRHQGLDLDFELLLAVLVVLGLAGGEKLLPFGRR